MGAQLTDLETPLNDVLPPAYQALTGFKWTKLEHDRMTGRWLWSCGWDDARTGKRVILAAPQSLGTEIEARRELCAALAEALT